jgi:hypothetical protein
MSNKKIIEYGLDFFTFDQDLFEPNELFYTRVWFILNNLHSDDNTDDFETLVKKSRLMINERYYECEYGFKRE